MKRIALAVLPLAMWLGACTVQKTEDGKAPDVEVDPGKLPEYQVDPAKVEIGRDTKTVVVPDIKVKTRKDTIH